MLDGEDEMSLLSRMYISSIVIKLIYLVDVTIVKYVPGLLQSLSILQDEYNGTFSNV
jgi:hypothetical protein